MSPANALRQVLVVGAGPSGLTLALLLAQNQVPVRIITKELSPRVGQRGSGIQGRSAELQKTAGLLPAILKYAIPGGDHLMRAYDTNPSLPDGERGVKLVRPEWPFMEHPPPTPGSSIFGFALSQDKHEEVLREALAKLDVQVEWGSELVSFTQDQDGVAAHLRRHTSAVEANDAEAQEESVNVGWLVGTDGARGIVRKALGLSFLGEKRPEGALVGDIRLEGNTLSRNKFHMWMKPGHMLVITATSTAPGDEDRFLVVVGGSAVDPKHILTNKEELLPAHITSVTGRTDVKIKQIDTISEYITQIRMVDKCRVGRVFVAGDAAHVHNPAGAQGMNTSIQDSFNLAWKLALVVNGHAEQSLLDTYSEERLPVVAEMLDMTTKLMQQTVRDYDAPASVAVIEQQASKGGSMRRGPVFQQLGVNYRWSSIGFDERLANPLTPEERAKMLAKAYDSESPDDRPRVGDRAPDGPCLIPASDGEPTTLLDIFRTTHHTALVFTSGTEPAPELIQALKSFPEGTLRICLLQPRGSDAPVRNAVDGTQTFTDSDGHAYNEYAVAIVQGQPTVVIVRPDAYVGAIVTSADGVNHYRDTVFSS